MLSLSSTMSFTPDKPSESKRHAANTLFQIPGAKTVLQLQKGHKFKWFIKVYWKRAVIFCLFLPRLKLKIAQSYLNPPVFFMDIKTRWSWGWHSRPCIQTAWLRSSDKNILLLQRSQLAANKPGKQYVKDKLVCTGSRGVNLKRKQDMHIILLPLVWTHLISASSFALKPQVRHTLYIQPKHASSRSVTEVTVCYTGQSLGIWCVGKDISGFAAKMYSISFLSKSNCSFN